MAQISIEDAFPTFQKRCGELFEQNLLLTAQVDTLERQLTAAETENARLREEAQLPTAAPDLAAQPLYADEPRG